MRRGRRFIVLGGALLGVGLFLAAWSELSPDGRTTPSALARPLNARPQIQFTVAPAELDSVFYRVHFQWVANDVDGDIDHYIHSIDPPPAGDTTWTTTLATAVTIMFESKWPERPLPSSHPIASSNFHVFVIKAVDNEGLPSPPRYRAFTTFTVAPEGRITYPIPSAAEPASTDTVITIEWEGNDPDGVTAQVPTGFAVKLALLSEVQGTLGLGDARPTAGDIQEYFQADAEWGFELWERIDSDTPAKMLDGLSSDTEYYFAVVTFDEAAAYDPLFSLDRNVLHFRTGEATQIEVITWGRVKAERR